MKVKSFIAALLLMVAGLQTADAQGFHVYKSDGTVVQFSLRTDSIVFYDGIGSDEEFGPFTPVNQCIVGTWYRTQTETVTFNEDGTTDYIEGATYKFQPYQGSIIIYNASGIPVNILKVHAIAAGTMVVSTLDGSFRVWGNTPQPQPVTSIVLSETALTLNTSETKTLTAVLPGDAANKEVIWESSNESVATVDQTGKVTAVAAGSCTITVTATDGSGTKAECAVMVIQLVTDITLSETSLTLPTGTTQTLTATIQPTNANNKKVIWSSSNENIATVDQTGKVTAVAPGSCTITATAADGSGVKAECAVTVIQLVTGITLNETSLTLYAGLTETLTATVEPANANNMAVTWESSDESVAIVDQTGTVTAIILGSCVITCRATDGSNVYAECQVAVDHEWVDLGLPSGTLWATCNVGANSPEECGDYFAWGETEPKYNFGPDNYKYWNFAGWDYTLITKYCTDSNCGYDGFMDNKTELDPEDDTATANWGSGWQMPSIAQCQELINSSYTIAELTTQNNMSGLLITSTSNGKSIFIPAAGSYYGGEIQEYYDWSGLYWSRSLCTENTYCAFLLGFNHYSNEINAGDFGYAYAREWGRTVRPVRAQGNEILLK